MLSGFELYPRWVPLETCQSRLFLAWQQYPYNKQTINWCACRVHSRNIERMLNDNYSHFVIMVPFGFNPFGNGQAPLILSWLFHIPSIDNGNRFSYLV